MDLSYQDLKQLSNLLKLPEENDSSDDDFEVPGISKLGPGDIKPIKVKVNGSTAEDNKYIGTNDPKAIWQLYEVPEIPVSDDASYDPRERPEYDIKYSQSVTPENFYLQLGLKTTATASCESMIITTSLKGEIHDDVDLQISKNHLDIRSPHYRLSLPLPHPVDPDKCSAEWDSDTTTLKITLFLNRELDYVNF